tara:strand:+ start:1086 stop:3374 length:2289 start_codon:yes stop_codon:yes gene_type:complete
VTYETQTAGASHDITAELRVGSGDTGLGNALTAITFSSKSGAYPLAQLVSVGAELNPLTTRRTLAGITAEVLDTLEVRRVFAPEYLVQARLVEDVQIYAPPGVLKFKVGRGEAAALVAALGAAPFSLHVGAETVVVSATASPVGVRYDELTISARAAGTGPFMSDQFAHPAGTPCGAAPQRWVGRIVSEFLIYPNGDERLVALYSVDEVPVFRDGVWSLSMQDALGFYNRTIGRGMQPARIADSGDYTPQARNLNAEGILIAGDEYVVEDLVNPGTFHLNPQAYRLNDRLVDAVSFQGQARGSKFVAANKPNAYLFPWAGRNGQIYPGGAADRPKVGDELEPVVVLHGRARSLIIELLTSARGDFQNGANDALIGSDSAQTGAGIPVARIDSLSVSRLIPRDLRWRIVISPGDLLLDVLERELGYLNLFFDIAPSGKLYLRKVRYPTSLQDVDWTLTDASAHSTATDELRMSNRMISRVKLSGNFDAAADEYRMQFNLPGQLTPENSLGEQVVFEPTWLDIGSVDDIEEVRQQLARLAGRWGSPRPAFALEHDWTAHLVRVGDTALVTNPRLPNSQGGLGVSLPALVTAVDSDLEAGLVRITAEAIGSLRGGYLCPAGEVQNVVPLGGTSYALTLATAALSRLTSGLMAPIAEADEAEYFAVGWGISGRDYATGVSAWTGSVTAIVGPTLTVTATAPPIVGEVVAPDAYGTFGPAPDTMPPLADSIGNRRPGLQLSGAVAYLFLADANETLGAANDDAKEWL